MYPGFHEGHGHLQGLGYQLVRLDMAGMTSLETIQSRVKEETVSFTLGASHHEKSRVKKQRGGPL